MYREINFTPTFKKLRDVFILYNEKLRLLKPHQYRKLSLKSTHMETAKELIRFYGAYLYKNKVRQLDPNRRFWVANTGIAKQKLQHRSTIYRHISILQNAGVITNKVFHGSCCGIEVEINEGLLVYKRTEADNRAWIQKELDLGKEEGGDGMSKAIVASSTHNDSRGSRETLKINTVGAYVDNLKKQETVGKKQESKSSLLGQTTPKEGCGVSQDTRVAGDDPEFVRFIDYYTERAWHFARSMLYGKQPFTLLQEQLVLGKIREYFALVRHELFNRPFVERIFKDFCQRILLTQRFVEKSPHRYVPFPWIYFDRHFEGGFKGTLHWLKAVKQKRERLKGYCANLAVLCNQYQRFMHEPSLENFKLGEKELSKKKDERLMDMYYNCVSDKGNYTANFLHNYYKQAEA